MDPQIVQPENCQRFAVNRATHKAIKTVNHINRITSTRQFSCSLTKNELDLGFFLFQWNAIVVFMLHEVLAYKFWDWEAFGKGVVVVRLFLTK